MAMRNGPGKKVSSLLKMVMFHCQPVCQQKGVYPWLCHLLPPLVTPRVEELAVKGFDAAGGAAMKMLLTVPWHEKHHQFFFAIPGWFKNQVKMVMVL